MHVGLPVPRLAVPYAEPRTRFPIGVDDVGLQVFQYDTTTMTVTPATGSGCSTVTV